MRMKIKNYITCFATAFFLFGFLLWGIIAPDKDVSTSERRPLAKMPKLTVEAVLDNKFMSDFENYTLDQFPLRDNFRTLKAMVSFYVFRQKDNNQIYVHDGYAAKMEYPLNDASITYAGKRFGYLYDTYMADKNINVYLTIVPDKSYFLADKSGCLSMDYEEFVRKMCAETPFAEYIDIMPLLSIDDYYATDTHWRQEKLLPVAGYLAEAMGGSLKESYSTAQLDKPFYGVYYGQSALPLPAENLYYLESPFLDACVIKDFETGDTMPVYDLEKGHGNDPYELFLSGSKSLIEITNPNASTDKELILFRDSFGSSIAPLFAENYTKVTLVDIRYIAPQILGRFIEFDDQDVLFLYSTSVLNNSTTLK